MRSIARRHPLAVFLAIAYGASAAIFALPLLSLAGIGVIDLDLPGVAPFVLLDTFALAGAAFITTALAEGRSGVRELRRRVFNFRVNPGWYVLAILLLPVAAMATAIVVGGVDVLAAIVGDPVTVLATIVVGSLLAFALVNLWEEAAWTGFALERLQPRLGPIGASVVTTWLQALVHVPLVFVVGGVTVGRVPAEQIPFYLVALFVLPIPVRIALTWLYNSSGRSVPIVGLAACRARRRDRSRTDPGGRPGGRSGLGLRRLRGGGRGDPRRDARPARLRRGTVGRSGPAVRSPSRPDPTALGMPSRHQHSAGWPRATRPISRAIRRPIPDEGNVGG